ncbi:hypothetical protein MOQ72_41415 [Saccharopolyspora sp. K220]|uniref:hypothetical protein n=1 Tax=Saccharopolyspora soli TaxID=2926618 RepID=UPI001F5961CD|nr:hypothetical protein [Saccharopolyspora soli]MCI2423880.1 hypothetical protein [Saccharopolyspora soli]
MSTIVRASTTAVLLVGLAACHEPGHTSTGSGDDTPRVIKSDFSADQSMCQDAAGETWTVGTHKPVGFACPSSPSAGEGQAHVDEPTSAQQRFAPDPVEFGTDVQYLDQPGEFATVCNPDGTVANYWPPEAWQDAVAECRKLNAQRQEVVDELNRRDPGAGWH